MKITSLAMPLVVLAGCSQPSIGTFAGTYTGTLTESYTCPSSTPPTFELTNQTATVTQLGSSVFFSLASCIGSDIGGDAYEDVVTLDSSTQASATCPQTDGADAGELAIQVTSFSGGTLTLTSNGDLQVNLPENAIINNESCTGTATGTLTLQ